jgi:CRISPR-associated protein Csd1
MALVKAYWKRKRTGGGENGMTAQFGPYLNESHPSPAYHCGRIMAVLGEIQRVALRDVGASVVQRYYGAASATPALVLGRLVRLAQFHLDKVESRKRRDALEQSLAGIWASIHDHVPATLTLEEQSLFALGYYQQKAAAKREAIVPADHGEKGDDQ